MNEAYSQTTAFPYFTIPVYINRSAPSMSSAIQAATRIAILYASYGPYHAARVNALGELLPGKVVAIQAYGSSSTYHWQNCLDDISSAETRVLDHRHKDEIDRKDAAVRLGKLLDEIDPTALVLSGYSDSIMRSALAWGRRRQVPTTLLMVSTYYDRPRRRTVEFAKGFLVRRFSAVAAVGARSEGYANRLGMPLDRIFRIGNVVDNDCYLCDTRFHQRDSIIIVARLSAEKNLIPTIRAYRKYVEQGGRHRLVICGEGPERPALEAAVENTATIELTGWVNGPDLVQRYGTAKAVLLPSLSEPWGLAINEGMAAGCIPIASNRCGCVPELIRDGWNGFVYPPNSDQALTKALHRIDELGEEEYVEMAQRSSSIIGTFTPSTWAQALAKNIPQREA